MTAPAQMPNHNQPNHDQPSRTPLARFVLALYPPSWRDRYGEEVRVLLDDSGAGPAAIASLAWRALPAWIRRPAQRDDRPARVRSHLSTTLLAGSMLAGLGLLFLQLTEFQGGYRPPGHPIVGWSYLLFNVAMVVSVLAAGIGGLPLWLLMLRRACRDKRPRLVVCLLAPILAPGAFLAGLAATAKLADQPDGLDLRWFGAVTAAGFVFAALAAVGPGLALRGLRPRGPALRLAATAGCVAAAAMAVAATALVVAVISLCRWNPWFAESPGYAISAFFCALVVTAAAVATVSAARGVRPRPASG